MLTANGLGSGLDINGLVTQLVASERTISDIQLNRETDRITSKFSALGSLKGSISSFQSTLSGLVTATDYDNKLVSSSDLGKVSATVTDQAVPNTYSIEVSQLAESHSLNSAAFVDADTTAIGTGSITIQKGTTDYVVGTDTYNSFTANPDETAVTITIDSSNNTLDGIAAAINASDAGVNAAVVNDGSGYRLLLSSEDTGLNQSLEVVVDDDDSNDTDTSGLSVLAFNSAATNLEQTNAAEDAMFTVNGLSVSNASNTVSTAINSVTLTLSETTTSPIEVSVSENHTAITTAVKTFVAGYNQFIVTANALSAYDVDTGVSGALLGDFTLRSVNGQIDSILRSSVTDISTSVQNLTDLGITTTNTGELVLNDAELDAILQDDPAIAANLLAEVISPDDEDVLFNEVTAATQVGTYAVNITQLATAGSYTGTGVLPDFGGGGTLTIDSDNDNFTIEIDGIDIGEISITQATYTDGDVLATEIENQINQSATLISAGGSVSVTYDSGTDSFSIASASEGSFSTVNMLAVDTNSAAELGFTVANGVAGFDVAGTIGGEAATGTGNILIADSETTAEGLSLTINGTTTGARGDVVFTRGIASQLDRLLEQVLEEEGALESRLDSFQNRLEEIDERRTSLELRWDALEERYREQFNALDILLANLNTTSAFLVNQLDNLNSLAQRSNNE